MKQTIFILVLLLVTLSSCSDGEEGLKEQTLIQSSEQIKAQNENQQMWSQRLSSDLEVRRNFIDALEGEYEGSFYVNKSSFKLRVIISPTIPKYEVDRVRSLAELEYELQNLSLNIHVVQWNPNSELSGVSCILEGVRPNISMGVIDIISQNCQKNTYKFFVADDVDNDVDTMSQSVNIASLIQRGSIRYVQVLKGKLRSNAKVYDLVLERM